MENWRINHEWKIRTKSRAIKMMKSKHAICLIAGIFLIMTAAAPVSADKIITTETKVFFEKDGQPYNEPVKFTVKCYGYVIDSTDPYYSNYWRGTYQKKDPGTYNTTEVFSYSATASGYGAKIYEPYYYKYLAFDYCTLYGETNGKKFVIENAGESPNQNCSWRQHHIKYNYLKGESEICYLSTNESDKCYRTQSMLIENESELCIRYLEKFDMKKLYSENTRAFELNGVMMVETEKYRECNEKADLINLNCDNYKKEVSCKDYCDPNGNPVLMDCSLYFTIPTDDDGNIIEIPEEEPKNNQTAKENTKSEDNESIFTIILKFLGLG